MEEKKLTDEEIIKALEYCSGEKGVVCNIDCPAYDLGVGTICQDKIIPYALDLIHRLQSELKKELAEHEEFTKKANAEIERLTEENLKYSIERGKILAEKDDIGLRLKEKQKQVDELQDRLASVLVGIKADELLVAKGIEQAVKDTAKEIYNELKTEVISVDIPRWGEPTEEDCEAVLWWKIEQILRKKAQVE